MTTSSRNKKQPPFSSHYHRWNVAPDSSVTDSDTGSRERRSHQMAEHDHIAGLCTDREQDYAVLSAGRSVMQGRPNNWQELFERQTSSMSDVSGRHTKTLNRDNEQMRLSDEATLGHHGGLLMHDSFGSNGRNHQNNSHQIDSNSHVIASPSCHSTVSFCAARRSGQPIACFMQDAYTEGNVDIEQMNRNRKGGQQRIEGSRTILGKSSAGQSCKYSRSDDDASCQQHTLDDKKLKRKKESGERHDLICRERLLVNRVGESSCKSQASHYCDILNDVDSDGQAVSHQSSSNDDYCSHQASTTSSKSRWDEHRHLLLAASKNAHHDRPQDELDSSQIAAHLMQIRDWSKQIMSTLEELDEKADPECKKLKLKLLSLLDDFKRSESDCSNLLRKVLAEREKELLLRQNLIESSFHCESCKSDEETELEVCSDVESVLTLEEKQISLAALMDRSEDSPLNNQRPRIESHLGHHSDMDVEDHTEEPWCGNAIETSKTRPPAGSDEDLSALMNRRSALESELSKRSRQLIDLREQHARLKDAMEHQQQLQAVQERQLAIFMSAGLQQNTDEDEEAPQMTNASSDKYASVSHRERYDEHDHIQKPPNEEMAKHTTGSAVSSSASSNLVQLNSHARVGAQDQHSGGFTQGQHSRRADQVLRTTSNTQCHPAGGTAYGQQATAAVQGQQPGGAAKRPLQASCSTVLSDCIDLAPDDLGEELSHKEIELLLLHQKQTEQRLRMLEERYGGGEQHTSNTGSGIVHVPDSNQTRQTAATSILETDCGGSEQTLSAILQLNPEMREKMSRLAAASERLKKLHELVSLAHQQSSAFAETGDDREHPPVTGMKSDTRLDVNHVSATPIPLQSRATSDTSHGVTRTASSGNLPTVDVDLRKEQQLNSMKQDDQLQRIEALQAKRDQLLAMEATLQQLIDSMQIHGQVESQTPNGIPSDVPSQEPTQHARNASNTVFSDGRVTDDAHSSALDESVQSSGSRSAQPMRITNDRPVEPTTLHHRDNCNSANFTSSYLLRDEQNRISVNDNLLIKSRQLQSGPLMLEQDHDNRLVQNNQRQSSREEPRRLNNQPMEGGAGIHVLHNVTSTSKNVHRRRSPDMTSFAKVRSEMQALRNDVQSLTAVVQSTKSAGQVPTDLAISCQQQRLLIDLERSFHELLANNVALCERMKKLEQLVYSNRLSSAVSFGNTESTPARHESWRPPVRDIHEVGHTVPVDDRISPTRSRVNEHLLVAHEPPRFKPTVKTASHRLFQPIFGMQAATLSGWHSEDVSGNGEESRTEEYSSKTSRSTGARTGGSLNFDEYSCPASRSSGAVIGDFSAHAKYSFPKSRPSAVTSCESPLQTGQEVMSDSSNQNRWIAVTDDNTPTGQSPVSGSGHHQSQTMDELDRAMSFDALRELIYSEVAALISQNETRPRYLIELFRRLQQLTTDGQRDMAVTSFERIVSDYLTEHDLNLELSSNRETNVNNHSSHVTSDWRSAIYQRFYDIEGSMEEGELCNQAKQKSASEQSLVLANSSEGIYSPDPDHDNEVSKSSEPEEVEEQLEASTDSDMDALAEKLGFVSINFTLAASPPSYNGDSWEKSADEELSDGSQQLSADNLNTPPNTSRELESEASEQEERPAVVPSSNENDAVVKSVLNAFSQEEIAERMASEFQGEDIVQGILNERDGITISDLTNHPFYLKPPDSS